MGIDDPSVEYLEMQNAMVLERERKKFLRDYLVGDERWKDGWMGGMMRERMYGKVLRSWGVGGDVDRSINWLTRDFVDWLFGWGVWEGDEGDEN